MEKRPVDRRAGVRLADVARLAGVSQMTVSNCFKHPDKVIPETRLKVLEAAAKLDYVPNLIARNLVSGRSKVIAAIVPTIQNSSFAEMIMGLEEELDVHGYHLIVSVVDSPDREYEAVRALIGRRVDGIVLTGVDRDGSTSRLIEQSGIPTVETWSLNGPFVDMGVGFMARAAARDATQLMIDKGLGRIGVVGYQTGEKHRYQERLAGFKDAMTAAGLPSDLVSLVPLKLGFSGGRAALTELLALDAELEGVFCYTDVLASGVVFDCMRRNWSIPDRLSVVGYGDYEIAAELSPGLTTVRSPGDKIGQEAAKMIIARYSDEEVQEQIVDVGYDIVRRGSV
ncbi:hypothetical protein N182_37850 [Sinorhizobium sp. GL2]|nr:hypothetical protein N182_37850 [Sinorhizobium sp. GL2]